MSGRREGQQIQQVAEAVTGLLAEAVKETIEQRSPDPSVHDHPFPAGVIPPLRCPACCRRGVEPTAPAAPRKPDLCRTLVPDTASDAVPGREPRPPM